MYVDSLPVTGVPHNPPGKGERIKYSRKYVKQSIKDRKSRKDFSQYLFVFRLTEFIIGFIGAASVSRELFRPWKYKLRPFSSPRFIHGTGEERVC